MIRGRDDEGCIYAGRQAGRMHDLCMQGREVEIGCKEAGTQADSEVGTSSLQTVALVFMTLGIYLMTKFEIYSLYSSPLIPTFYNSLPSTHF